MKVEEKRNMQKTIAFKNVPFVPEDNQVILGQRIFPVGRPIIKNKE